VPAGAPAAAAAPAPPRPAPPRPAPPRPAPEPARWSDEPVSALAPHEDDTPAAAPTPPPSAPRLVAKKEPAKKAAAKKPAPKVVAAWVDPKGNICPKSHPVKAKLASKIFQVPGHFAYDRTNPDRCYKNPKLAEGDGFRSAKR
jgi:micrococcal nuclease